MYEIDCHEKNHDQALFILINVKVLLAQFKFMLDLTNIIFVFHEKSEHKKIFKQRTCINKTLDVLVMLMDTCIEILDNNSNDYLRLFTLIAELIDIEK